MILVTGGARSGKSRHAEALIGDSSQVLYIATSQILDDEMAARIEHHRQGRPAHWRTVERWQHLDELIHADINPHEAVLLECVTTMVTNLLFDYGGDKDPDEWDYQAMEQAIIPVSLGKRILRTETAGLTILSILMYHLECEIHNL